MQAPSSDNSPGVWQVDTATRVPGSLQLITHHGIFDKHSLLSALATTLRFPTHFGNNWDAAWDCLSELSWKDQAPRVLLLDIATESHVDEQDLSTFIELLSEACQFWQEHGRTLTLLVASGRDDLPCIQQLPAWPVA